MNGDILGHMAITPTKYECMKCSINLKASKWYKTKPLNIIQQKWNQDGTVDITIFKEG
jgi:hypothetical protein